MKRTLLLVIMAVLICWFLPEPAGAQVGDQPEHANGSIGFHSISAPLGARWWFTGQKVGVDLGLGFASNPAPSYDERLSDWTLEVGVPIVVKNWDRVHLLFRPGLLYTSEEQQMTSPPDPFATDERTTFTVAAEIETEIFIVRNVSVSASQGIGFSSVSPAGGGDSDTSWGTLGNNFTNIGFHVYFFGGDGS